MEYITAKTIITKNKNTNWFGTDYNMNIYRGCSHGCIYCDSRSDCYHVPNFDTVTAKENALEIIHNELKKKTKTGVIGTGAMSDPYNPCEKEFLLTRGSLELINTFYFGIGIATKSTLITRDIDILQDIKRHSPVICKITITTANDNLCKKIEPNVAPTSERFDAIKKLSEKGIYAGVLMMPILPFINDTKENILYIVNKAKDSGARFIFPSFGVTLRGNQRDYYYNKISALSPNLKSEYIKEFKDSYVCNSPNTKELYYTFAKECDKVGLLYNMKQIIKDYKADYSDNLLDILDI